MEDVWEDSISRNNSRLDTEFEILGPAASYRASDPQTDWSGEEPGLGAALARDTYPLPNTDDREGYYGQRHFSYWASGYRDSRLLLEACERNGLELRSYLDFGCSSGRVLRHFGTRPETAAVSVYGCDINRKHVDWVTRYLSLRIVVFQNHSIPTLPLADSTVDLVSAFSVFTHIEAFDTSWLMELRRVLRTGGLAWITVHTERTWQEMGEGWPLFQALLKHPDFAPYVSTRDDLPHERLIFRWRGNRSYTSHVFYEHQYLNRVWGRIMDIREQHHRPSGYQDVVVFKRHEPGII